MKGASTSHADFTEMFAQCISGATASLSGIVKPPHRTSATILNHTRGLTVLVRTAYPSWDDYCVRLGVAALAIYRLRPIDMGNREHCLILWIAEGGVSMRAHTGSCYIYNDCGAFLPYKGVPPETTLARMKEFLLQLEGLFRCMPMGVRRTDIDLLASIDTLMSDADNLREFLHKCADAALFNQGDDRVRPARMGAFGGDVEDGAGPPSSWPILTAQAMRKLGMQMQRELLEGKLLSYLIEWCDSPMCAQPGVCYTDVCLLYETSATVLLQCVQPSPANNLLCHNSTSIARPCTCRTPETLGAILHADFLV